MQQHRRPARAEERIRDVTRDSESHGAALLAADRRLPPGVLRAVPDVAAAFQGQVLGAGGEGDAGMRKGEIKRFLAIYRDETT